MRFNGRNRRMGRRPAFFALALITGTAACVDTSTLLQVDNPGRVGTEALNDPRLAVTLTNSVIADVECSWNNYVAAASHHSDEWMQSSGNNNMKGWGLRQVDPAYQSYASGDCGSNYGLFTTLHTARFLAETTFDRIQGFSDAAVPNRTALLARVRTYGAYPLLAFGEGFCGTPIDGSDKVFTRAEVMALAEERFTTAITLAQQANLPDMVNLALVGRARARLGQAKYAGAIEDAARVPANFVFRATRDATSGRRQNAQFRVINGTTATSSGQKHASIAPSYRNVTWKGVADPRVNVQWDGVSLGFDNSTPHYRHNKAGSYDAPVTMASGREALLIIAEAAAMSGDLARARDVFNTLHTAAGIPPVTVQDTPDQAATIRQLIEERRRELFAEGGHRMRDHVRWRDTPYKVPFLGEPGSDHPNGVDQYGAVYGAATCFPVPLIEQF